jgi:small-conductance mechanosensitive channel
VLRRGLSWFLLAGLRLEKTMLAERRYIPTLAIAITLLGSAAASAQSTTDDLSDVRLAPVIIDGETLFSVRGVTAHPAERRAREIQDRIRALAQDPKFDPKSLTVEHRPGVTSILAGEFRVMSLLDEDAAVEQANREPIAALYRLRIVEAIESYRRARRPQVLGLDATYSALALFALFAGVYLGRNLVAILRKALERRYRPRVQDIQERAHRIIKADQIWRVLMALLNLVWALGVLAGVYACLHFALSLFPWTRGFANRLFAIAVDPLRTIGLGVARSIPSLIFLLVLVVLVRYALKLTRLFFEDVARGGIALKGFYPEWAMPTYRLVRLLVIALAAVVAYPYVPGSGSQAFKGVSLFIGVIFSLGSSSLIGNVIAGYTMVYRRAFKIGDRVKIGQNTGDVEQMRLLVTHLRTIKNEELIIPNSTILTTDVINYSSIARDQGLILHTTVGIGYETPWRQVEAMLLESAARTPGLREDLPPFVLQTLLGDFCITYELNVYCEKAYNMELRYADLHRNILDVFNEYGIQIMTPAYRGDPEQPKVVPKDQWYASPAQMPASHQGKTLGAGEG